jgi:hypothetical protein
MVYKGSLNVNGTATIIDTLVNNTSLNSLSVTGPSLYYCNVTSVSSLKMYQDQQDLTADVGAPNSERCFTHDRVWCDCRDSAAAADGPPFRGAVENKEADPRNVPIPL